MLRNFTIIIILFLSTFGPALVIGLVGAAAVKAVGRNPSASGRILAAMVLAFLFAESIAILAILTTFMIFK